MDQNAQNELVERIVKSDSFGTSALYLNLLNYLVKSSQSGEVPKEATVGIHIFGDSEEERSDNGKVRVHVFNLRKKLQQYFENEGIDEKIILTIPKGSYGVEFQQRVSKGDFKSLLAYGKTKWALLIMVGALIIIAPLYLNFKKSMVVSKEIDLAESLIWKDIMESKRPILIVLGDMFVFSERNKIRNDQRTIRIPEVNSMQEFEEYKKSHINDSVEWTPLTYAFLIKNSIDWIQGLTKLFYANERTFQFRVISRVEARDLHDYNIVFVGTQKTSGLFKNYFSSSEFSFSDSLGYSYKGNHYAPTGDADRLHKDYAFVAKYAGPSNNVIFMFSGIWDTGPSQCLDNFLNVERLRELESTMISRFGKIPNKFEALFEVTGVDRTEMDTKLLYLIQPE